MLLVLSNNLGVPKFSALEAMDLLEVSLDLERVRSIITLDGLRDLLPDLSTQYVLASLSPCLLAAMRRGCRRRGGEKDNGGDQGRTEMV